ERPGNAGPFVLHRLTEPVIQLYPELTAIRVVVADRIERPTATVLVCRRAAVAQVVDDHAHRQVFAELAEHAGVVGHVRCDAATAIGLGQRAETVAIQRRGPVALVPGDAAIGLAAPLVVIQRIADVAHFVIGELLVLMLQHQGVGQARGEAAIATRIEAPVALQVDAAHRLRCRIDRVDQYAGHLVRLHGGSGGVADHPRKRVLAQRRADVARFAAEGAAQPAIGLITQDAAGVEAGHFVVDADVVVVGAEIQPGQWRPDHAEAIRLGRLGLQLRVGAVAVVDRQAVVVAVVIRLAGGAAAPVVGHAGVVATGLGGEHIVHVRRTEAGGRGAADQQAFDRTEFDTEAPGRLADMLAAGAVLVVATCQGGGQRLQQRQLQFNTGRVAVTFATGTDAGAGVPEFAGAQARVRAVAVAL